MSDYDDIINMPRWNPRTHKRMSLENRASQFAPFAALVGYDEAIAETARLTDIYSGLDEIAIKALNQKIALLIDSISAHPDIEVTYFVADTKKDGGSYVVYRGNARKIDEVESCIIFVDGTKIPLSVLVGIEGDIFDGLDS